MEKQHFQRAAEQERAWSLWSSLPFITLNNQALFKALTGKCCCWMIILNTGMRLKCVFLVVWRKWKSISAASALPVTHQISPQAPPSSPDKKALPSLHSNGLSKAAVSDTLDFPQSETRCWALPFEFVLTGRSHAFAPVRNVLTHKPSHPFNGKHFDVANFGYLQDILPLLLPIPHGILTVAQRHRVAFAWGKDTWLKTQAL